MLFHFPPPLREPLLPVPTALVPITEQSRLIIPQGGVLHSPQVTLSLLIQQSMTTGYNLGEKSDRSLQLFFLNSPALIIQANSKR